MSPYALCHAGYARGQATFPPDAHTLFSPTEQATEVENVAKLSKKLSQASQKAMDRLDLPVNLASGVARMELLGNRSFYIDRHRGVLSYSTEAVDINAGTVVVRVQGEGLELAVMTDEELRINGVIRRVELVE